MVTRKNEADYPEVLTSVSFHLYIQMSVSNYRQNPAEAPIEQ